MLFVDFTGMEELRLRRKALCRTGEARLLMAVLIQASADLTNRNVRIASAARDWLLSEHTEFCTDFAAICELLGLSASAVRGKLLADTPVLGRYMQPVRHANHIDNGKRRIVYRPDRTKLG